jgi:hypothetical protein
VKALFTVGTEVPFSRVAADHRKWLVPLGAVLAINVALLITVVLPLERSVQSGGQRASVSAAALAEARADFKNAEATRDGQAQATKDLDRFYTEVLPVDFASARRILQLKFNQMARQHDVTFERSSTTPERARDSNLEQLKVTFSLSGEWEDIRALIHAIETAPEFVVIDNMALSEGAAVDAPLTLALEVSTFYLVGPRAR